ncbi:MAG: sigma-70 family RNA polymerase sigma factor [Planctomycetaceae bacterium]|nr:sigma-70 family RNA polymerase sigma factor [Planctomycetaceae bacterium]
MFPFNQKGLDRMDIPASPDPDPLMERILAGDERAFAEAFAEHRERLWRMVHFRLDRRLQGRVDADDILQEAYLDAVKRLPHFAESQPMSLFVWLRLVVGQTLIDVHRRHLGAKMRDAEREESIQQRLSEGTSLSLSFHLLAHLTSPSLAAQRAELTALVEEALGGMSDTDREVLALRHFEELTNSEVAEVLGLERKAASIRYVRALARLKIVLEKIPGFFADDSSQSSVTISR